MDTFPNLMKLQALRFYNFFHQIIKNLLATCKIVLTFNSCPFCRRHHSLGLNRHHSLGLGTIMPEVKKEFTDEEMKVAAACIMIKSLRAAANYVNVVQLLTCFWSLGAFPMWPVRGSLQRSWKSCKVGCKNNLKSSTSWISSTSTSTRNWYRLQLKV